MKSQTAQKIKSSTQNFTEIENIKEDIVMLSGGSACLIIEIQATNFALLSLEEQQAKIIAYASLLNSLSFPIQIVIRNKRVDISSYLKLLENQVQKIQLNNQSSNDQAQKEQVEKRISFMEKYRVFVENLIKVDTILNKAFYMVISYSSLERGVSGVVVKKEDFFGQAKAALHTKSESLLVQLSRIGLKSKILGEDGLIRLFYDIYNQEADMPTGIQKNITAPVVQSIQNQK